MTEIFRVAVIPADGIGPEVMRAGIQVLEAAASLSAGEFEFEWNYFDWGSEYYSRHGKMMPDDGVERLKSFDAIYFGAVGWPTVPDHVSLWGLRLKICQGLDQWANIRPVRFLPGVVSPMRHIEPGDLEWVVVRENSEGEYSGFGGRNFSGRPGEGEVAIQSAVFTEAGVARIVRYAFEEARKRAVKHVTSVTKSNAQQYAMVLWDEVFQEVAQEYPDVTHDSCLVDAMAARMLLEPESLSVVVASNLNADILSDLGSAMTGSLGTASSANLNPEKRTPSMFEPVHGTAPDIAGKGIANPIGTISSGALMLKHFGKDRWATRIEQAIDLTTASKIFTADLGGSASTTEVTEAIIYHLGRG